MNSTDEIIDMREPGEAFCTACPDHEACATGYPCSLVRRVNRYHDEEVDDRG